MQMPHPHEKDDGRNNRDRRDRRRGRPGADRNHRRHDHEHRSRDARRMYEWLGMPSVRADPQAPPDHEMLDGKGNDECRDRRD